MTAAPEVITCTCGRIYSLEQFASLPQPPRGDRQYIGPTEDEPGYWLIFRNCTRCSSTITRTKP